MIVEPFIFSGCKNLSIISIPNNVVKISWRAFYNCTNLTSITIPINVTTIESWAFKGCTALSIHAEISSEPEGWENDWNPDNRPVIWGSIMP